MSQLDIPAGRTLVFGASGQIGTGCADALTEAGHTVDRLARRPDPTLGILGFDPFDTAGKLPAGPFGAVVWAQGANGSDSILAYDREAHLELYRANTLFVVETFARLLAEGRLMDGARLCIVSSVWQTVGRQAKLSYMMSKAALQGLVSSAAIDLAERGMLVNAVLPGALDTPMTHANLSTEQIERIAGATPFGRLPAVADVAALVTFLCSPANISITGQFIAVDLGFRNAHLV